MLDQEVLEIARAGSVSEETARGMMEWHGRNAMEIARMALVSAELRAPICPHSSHIVAEVVGLTAKSLPSPWVMCCCVAFQSRSEPAGLNPAAAKPRYELAQCWAGKSRTWEQIWNRLKWSAPHS